MTRSNFLLPVWLYAWGKHGRLGLLSLLYLRRRLEEEGLYPHRIGDSTILQLIRQRQAAWHQPMKWDAGPEDYKMHSPEGVKTWLNKDLVDFKRLCSGENDDRLAHSHARTAMVRTNRIDSVAVSS